ncbi:hypothetical protein LT337_07250 [Mycolicibacterium fortuitum]|nr:hypothetical protein LT337_07250 [Mycolicibacterium fortuitum]
MIDTPDSAPIRLHLRHDNVIVLNWSIGNTTALAMDSTLCRLLADHLHDLADEAEQEH